MDKFARTTEPEELRLAREDLCRGDYLADVVWSRFRQRNAYKMLRENLLAISQQTCAFCAGGFAQSPVTVEHFVPKAGESATAGKVLDWHNLFPACAACQTAKGAKFDHAMLKPDLEPYRPEKYFCIDVDDGSLKPLPSASTLHQTQAATTIDIYDLDRAALKKERRRAVKQLLQSDTAAVAFDEYRFLKELFA